MNKQYLKPIFDTIIYCYCMYRFANSNEHKITLITLWESFDLDFQYTHELYEYLKENDYLTDFAKTDYVCYLQAMKLGLLNTLNDDKLR